MASMRPLIYIFLIAFVLWVSVLYEQAHAPVLVSEPPVEEVATSTSAVAEEPRETAVVIEVAERPASTAISVETPAKTTAASDPEQTKYDEAYVEALELAIHNRVNEERKNQGLKTLEYDNVLANVAAYHSTDMAVNDYFAHDDPDGCDSACRATAAGYEWRMVGENLFLLEREYHFSAEGASAIVVAGWMGSEGHRENLFEPDFTHEGLGVVILGDKIYVTEVLARPR